MASAATPAPADAVDQAATAAAGEEAAPGRHTGGPTAGGRTGSEVWNGSLSGTVERQIESAVKLIDSNTRQLKLQCVHFTKN